MSRKQSVSVGKIPIVVTTEHRGVFFGFVPRGTDLTQTILRLEQAQMCVSWSAQTRGVLGLAATGPRSGSKIGPPVPSITLQKITSVMEASDEAVQMWQAQPW